jgi:hypothetical protein
MVTAPFQMVEAALRAQALLQAAIQLHHAKATTTELLKRQPTVSVQTMFAQHQKAILANQAQDARAVSALPASALLLQSQARCALLKPLVEAASPAPMDSARIPQDKTALALVAVKAAFALARARAALAFLVLPPSAPFAPQAPLAATASQANVSHSQPLPGLFPSPSLWVY